MRNKILKIPIGIKNKHGTIENNVNTFKVLRRRENAFYSGGLTLTGVRYSGKTVFNKTIKC